MQCGDYVSPATSSYPENAPYSSSLATTASASSASIWSDASSQASDDTSLSAPTSDCEPRDNRRAADAVFSSQPSDRFCDVSSQAGSAWAKLQTSSQGQSEVPLELRQNPRRSSTSSTSRSGCPPPLVRQADRKVNFVDNLVDSSTQIVEAIWPTSSVVCRNEGNGGVLPLRTFIQETLRRSRTSYSTLQVALYYLVLIKPHVPKHDFTMEQSTDCHAVRALQCGRRMFLAALILASKYLQDRNYSARAWSKISGLNTQEINQNEKAFLLAVNWNLHITEEVYNRWTDSVMRHTPSQPPSPGGMAQRVFERQCEEFRRIVLKLEPGLDNLEDVIPGTAVSAKAPLPSTLSPKMLFPVAQDRTCTAGYESDVTPTPKSYGTPVIMEPPPSLTFTATPGRLAPALGLLPTPRLTPQASGFSTPAVSAASCLLGKTSLSMAMAQASSVNMCYSSERWPVSNTSSPQSYFTATRRSSLATSVSTASSPESMVSDSSGLSRSSSLSSSSLLAHAPAVKLDVQARCRYAKMCSERLQVRPTVASVPEDYEENAMTSSPESYTGPVGKDLSDLSLHTPLGRRECEMAEAAQDFDAARALQELQHYQAGAPQQSLCAKRAGLKRSRTISVGESALQDNVRDILHSGADSNSGASWRETMVRSRTMAVNMDQVPQLGRKRVRCAAEDALPQPLMFAHPSLNGFAGPGMWEGILN